MNSYRLYCEICGYSRYSDGTDVKDLVPYKRSEVPTTPPKLDPKTNKTTPSITRKLPKKFKCPKCGRLIGAKKLKDDKNNNPGSEISPS